MEQFNKYLGLDTYIETIAVSVAAAYGRKRPSISTNFKVPERPLSGKAVIRKITHLFVMLFSIFAHEL